MWGSSLFVHHFTYGTSYERVRHVPAVASSGAFSHSWNQCRSQHCLLSMRQGPLWTLLNEGWWRPNCSSNCWCNLRNVDQLPVWIYCRQRTSVPSTNCFSHCNHGNGIFAQICDWNCNSCNDICDNEVFVHPVLLLYLQFGQAKQEAPIGWDRLQVLYILHFGCCHYISGTIHSFPFRPW